MNTPKDIIRMQKARGRFVNFRVTEDEFEQLKLACNRHGDPSMSVFARKAILNAPNPIGGTFFDQLNALDRRLSILEIAVNPSSPNPSTLNPFKSK